MLQLVHFMLEQHDSWNMKNPSLWEHNDQSIHSYSHMESELKKKSNSRIYVFRGSLMTVSWLSD